MEGGEDPVELCVAGRIGSGVAAARLLLAGWPAEAVFARIEAAAGRDAALAALLEPAGRARIRTVRRLLDEAAVTHEGAAPPEAVASMFDRLAALSPEAAVALYSLGDPRRLAEATDEIVLWLAQEALLGRDRDVLDLGCGIGRVALAIAPHARRVLGTDVSAVMLGEAERRRRAAAVRNVVLARLSGHGLDAIAPAGFDLVLAVDSMPYLVASGHDGRHLADIAGVLRPGGALAVLNLSYRGLAEDRARAQLWAAAHGFEPVLLGAAPFRLWDGRAFILRRS